MLAHACKGTGCWCAGPLGEAMVVLELRPSAPDPIVIDRLPAPGPVTISCEAVPYDPTEVARLRESEPLTYRGQRDAALARIAELEREVARLEALIVEAVAFGPGHVPDCIYNEARSIRSRKP